MTSISEIFDIIFSRKIIIFGGEFGRGKTLCMTAYAYFASILNNKNNILSNYPIKLGKVDKINTYIPLTQTSQFDETSLHTLFIMDEMQNDLDSRDFMSPKNRYLMSWAKGLRKDDSQVIGSIQYFDFLEKRLSDLLQMIIIPTWVKQYSESEKKDIQMRLENKDFRSKWYVIDKKTNNEYIIPSINLYNFINMYDTNFKTNPLIVTHKEFLQHMKDTKSAQKYENYINDSNERIKYSLEHWLEGEKEL